MDNKIQSILKRGVVEAIDKDNIVRKLKSGKRLRVKFGIDPTGADLHLGHTVNLWKLRQFQDLGHTAVVIIGDYTASIGDPSGKDKTRPRLSDEQIQENYKLYEEQTARVLRKNNLEIRKQTEWFGNFSLKDVIRLTSSRSVGEMLSRETFKERLRSNSPFSTHELLYPFLQGYDSVAVDADIELGAIEQKFNLLMGRVVQKSYSKEPQDVIMSSYLSGTDGKEKMSKSLNNYIGLRESPDNMFGKVMSIDDKEIVPYFEMVTDISDEELEEIRKKEIKGEVARDIKADLAFRITSILLGKKEAQEARDKFFSVFQKGLIKEAAKRVVIEKEKILVAELLMVSGLVSSKSEAKRRIKEGSVYIGEDKKTDAYEMILLSGREAIVRVGKRRVASVIYKKK